MDGREDARGRAAVSATSSATATSPSLANAIERVAALEASDSSLRLAVLVEDLQGRPDSFLAAFFDTPPPGGTFELTGAAIGAPADLAVAPHTRGLPQEVWPHEGEKLGVVVWHPAQGRLGAVRTAAWLQTVLGAIGLAAYSVSRTLAPLATCPGLETAVFVGDASGAPIALDAAARSYQGAALTDLRALFANSEAVELMDDATAREPADLVQTRLTLAARWLQAASSAVSTADALVMLGVALESLAGDDGKVAVVERITN